MNQRILIIDDEPDIRQLLSITVSRMGFTAYCVDNLKQGYEALQEHVFHLCLTDLRLPDGSGIDIVKHIQQHIDNLPVIVITAHGSMDLAIRAMKYGAFDFINKPVDLQHLRSLISNGLFLNDSSTQSNKNTQCPEIIGDSDSIQSLKQNIIKVSRSQAPVFIFGESGSGKELVARSIHYHSSRADQPFVAVNCGAIPTELMESELFGHVKGSFTGAHKDKDGLFQTANNGTLLLDEIADLPLEMQVKLLRVIQEKKIRPIGGQEEISIDVRIISSTHKDLSKAVLESNFRSDLFYRINVIEIPVPPLRERMNDISLLSNALLEKISHRNNVQRHELSVEAIDSLKQYTYPGNVRELENILERACALTEGNIISPDCLSFPEQIISDLLIHQAHTPATSPAKVESHVHYDASRHSIDEYLEGIEKDILLKFLDKNRWNRTATAKELGITFRSLRYRLKKLGIETDSH